MALMVVGPPPPSPPPPPPPPPLSPQTGASVASLLGPALDAQVNNSCSATGPPSRPPREHSSSPAPSSLPCKTPSAPHQRPAHAETQEDHRRRQSAPFPSQAESGQHRRWRKIRAQQIAANPTQAQQHSSQFNRSVFEEKLMEALCCAHRASPFTAQVLGALRQYLYDTDDTLRGNIDSGFRVANRITRDLLIQVPRTHRAEVGQTPSASWRATAPCRFLPSTATPACKNRHAAQPPPPPPPPPPSGST